MYHSGLWVCPALVSLLLLFFAVQNRRSLRRRNRLVTAVLVNGTRGKSSTTRLITAGLRAGRLGPVLGKTTGTRACWLLPDGAERAITRRGPANIREMAAGLSLAERLGVTAYVAECMAIRPEYQKITERWIRPDIAVITNIRLDHEEVFGSDLAAIARGFAAALPRSGMLVAHAETVERLRAAAGFSVARVVIADPDLGREWLGLFSGSVMLENLSLALTVCALLGVPPEDAARSMARARPDSGDLEIKTLRHNGRTVHFVGAFAANDAESTRLIAGRHPAPPGALKGVWLHGRKDRRHRSRSLCAALSALDPDFLVVSGDTHYIANLWEKHGLRAKLFSLPLANGRELTSVLDGLPQRDIWLLGIGNAKGLVPQDLGEESICRKLSSASS